MPESEGTSQRRLSLDVLAVLLCLGVALAALGFLFPLSGDDWAWGSDKGIDRWRSHFADYNGRYVGNVVVLVLTRATWLAPFVVAGTVCLIVWMMATIGRLRVLHGVLAAAGLFLAMPVWQWRQTMAWISGFTNYTVACLVLLMFVLSVQGDWSRRTRRQQPWVLLLFPFVVAGQLVMEHVTLYLTVASLVNLGCQVWKRKRPSLLSVVWATGAVIGAVIMFSNSAYRSAAAGTAYQDIGAGAKSTGATGLWGVVRQGTGGVSQYLVTANTVLNATLFVLVLLLVLAARRRGGRTDRLALVAIVLGGVGLSAGVAVSASVEFPRYFGPLTPWSWICGAALLSALLLTAWRVVEDSVRGLEITGMALSVVVLAAPMAAVTPYGPRNFLPTYVLMICIALALLAELLEREPSALLTGTVVGLSGAVVLATLTGYFAIYRAIDTAADRRLATLREAVDNGQRQAIVRTLPFREYVHHGDPVPGHWADQYKRFYDLPSWFNIRLVDRNARPGLTLSDDAG